MARMTACRRSSPPFRRGWPDCFGELGAVRCGEMCCKLMQVRVGSGANSYSPISWPEAVLRDTMVEVNFMR